MPGDQQTRASGNGIKLVLGRGLVGLPLTWGIVQRLLNAIKAFQ